MLKGEALVSLSSFVFGSGALSPLGFCASAGGFDGTLGLPVLLTGGGSFAEGPGSATVLGGFGLLAKSILGGSEACVPVGPATSKAAGEAALLTVRE